MSAPRTSEGEPIKNKVPSATSMPAARTEQAPRRAELVDPRRRNRVLEMEIEIPKRSNAYFARENVLPQ